MALCEWARGEHRERMRDAFYNGYARLRTLLQVQWSLLDLFVATQFATVVLWSSPSLRLIRNVLLNMSRGATETEKSC